MFSFCADLSTLESTDDVVEAKTPSLVTEETDADKIGEAAKDADADADKDDKVASTSDAANPSNAGEAPKTGRLSLFQAFDREPVSIPCLFSISFYIFFSIFFSIISFLFFFNVYFLLYIFCS